MYCQFPFYFEPVLERLLALSSSRQITSPWTALLEPISPRLTALDTETAARLLKTTTLHIPAPPPFFSSILFLALRLSLNAGILTAILEGNEGGWELVEGCVVAAVRTPGLADEDMKSVMVFIRELVLACPMLVDRIWGLYCKAIFPYLAAGKSPCILSYCPVNIPLIIKSEQTSGNQALGRDSTANMESSNIPHIPS